MFFKIIAFYIFTLSTFAFSSVNDTWTKKTYDEIFLGYSILEKSDDPNVQELLQEFLNLQPLSELPLITISEEQQRDYERLTNPEVSKSYTEYLQYVAKIAAQYFNDGDITLPEYTVVIRKCTLHINNIIGKFNAAHEIFVETLKNITLEPEEKLILALNYKNYSPLKGRGDVNLFYQFLLIRKLRLLLQNLSNNQDKLTYKQTLDFLLTSSIIDDSPTHYNKFNLNLVIKGTPLKPSHFYSGRRISNNELHIEDAREELVAGVRSRFFSEEERSLLAKIITPLVPKIKRTFKRAYQYLRGPLFFPSNVTFDVAIDLLFYILHADEELLTHTKKLMSPPGCYFIDISHPSHLSLKTSLSNTIGGHVDNDFDHLAIYFMNIFTRNLLNVLSSEETNKPELIVAYLETAALKQGLTWDALKEFFTLNADILPLSDVFDKVLSSFFHYQHKATTTWVRENERVIYPYNFSPKQKKDIIEFLPRLFDIMVSEYNLKNIDIADIVSKFEKFLSTKEAKSFNNSNGNSHSL